VHQALQDLVAVSPESLDDPLSATSVVASFAGIRKKCDQSGFRDRLQEDVCTLKWDRIPKFVHITSIYEKKVPPFVMSFDGPNRRRALVKVPNV
jgi:hypothetical protein